MGSYRRHGGCGSGLVKRATADPSATLGMTARWKKKIGVFARLWRGSSLNKWILRDPGLKIWTWAACPLAGKCGPGLKAAYRRAAFKGLKAPAPSDWGRASWISGLELAGSWRLKLARSWGPG